jgi:3-hydroxyisobutyrate dehydrogenase-like beta-hydroxyacid dehydrogenase
MLPTEGEFCRVCVYRQGQGIIANRETDSEATQKRARESNVQMVSTDLELCNEADYILSIAPQKDTRAIADRVIAAVTNPNFMFTERKNPLYFLDMNAVSPRTARDAYEHFASSAPAVKVIDGGITGGPPKLNDNGSWYRPGFVVSGPHRLHEAPLSGEHLAKTLNVRHINDDIGSASGVKMCFAAIHKGFTALATQSLTAAHNLGVLTELQEYLEESPLGSYVNSALPVMPPKAYRWVQEMEEIADTFEQDGGFSREESIFRPIGQVYELIANGTELGKEQTDDRKCGKTAEGVAALTSAGIEKRKIKIE